MNRLLVVTIDGEKYRVSGEHDAEETLAEFQRLMRDDAFSELKLAGGQPMVVNWGRVTAVSVADVEPREELTYSGQTAEPRWPQRPF